MAITLDDVKKKYSNIHWKKVPKYKLDKIEEIISGPFKNWQELHEYIVTELTSILD